MGTTDYWAGKAWDMGLLVALVVVVATYSKEVKFALLLLLLNHWCVANVLGA